MLGSVNCTTITNLISRAFYYVTPRGNERKTIFKSQRGSGRTLKEIGTYFNIGESGGSQTTRRVSDKFKKDKKPTRKINRIKSKLNL